MENQVFYKVSYRTRSDKRWGYAVCPLSWGSLKLAREIYADSDIMIDVPSVEQVFEVIAEEELDFSYD